MSAATSPSSTAAPRPRNAFQVAADLFDPPAHPYADDPVGYARQELGFAAWSKQAEILEAVHDHPRVAVRSSHGPGKTATAAQVALWFLECHVNSRVITTAPTWAQVEQLLWREIRSGVARAHQAGRGQRFPTPAAAKIEIGEMWFAIGLSTNEPERFQGHHADHLLLIVDEASGVAESIFEAAEGFLTAQGAHILLLGNPTRTGGQFHRAFTTERADWHTIHISTFDTPNYTGETVPADVARSLPREGWAEEKARAWGVDSPMYQVRVLGNFPSRATNAVIPLYLVEQAQAAAFPPDDPGMRTAVISCDPARFGDDETVIARRVGDEIRIVDTWIAPPEGAEPTVYAAGRIAELARPYRQQGVRIVIDGVGVGGGVVDILRSEGWPVTEFNGGHAAYRPDDFPNRRSELWYDLLDELPTLDLDPDEQLAADLTAPVYRITPKGQRQVEPKDDTKKRLGRSPDRADAVMMTLVPPSPGVITEPAARTAPADGWEGPSTDFNPLTESW